MSQATLPPAGGIDATLLHEVANQFGTPTYVYSADTIRHNIGAIQDAFAQTPHKVHYSVKANSALAVLQLCQAAGCGFDIVSGGELVRVIRAGGDASDVIFSGVGKTIEEIDLALKLGIGCFNVESAGELQRIADRAKLAAVVAPVSIRVNPDVDAQTHPYISTGLKENKFGVTASEALSLYQTAAADEHLKIVGIDCHIGSQISQAAPLLDALQALLELIDDLGQLGIEVDHIDLGGGMGVTYQDEAPLDMGEYGARVQQAMSGRTQQIYLEPGRSIVANAGVLLTHVEYTKPSAAPDTPNFAIVNAAMNDLIRPALYQAWHQIDNIGAAHSEAMRLWNIVGPVCESGDFLGKAREMSILPGDLLAIGGAGAYGMVQASNYNSRPRAAEVIIDGSEVALIRRRESIEDLLRLETLVQ